MYIKTPEYQNEQGHLTIGGVDTVMLAKKYQTPLYVLDENVIRANCRAFIDSMKQYYGGNGKIFYASKALCCKEICRIMATEHMGLDTVSLGEMYTALEADFPAEDICFHGNNKTEEEISFAVHHQIGRMVVDNFEEFDILEKAAEEAKRQINVLIRVKPGVDAHTHKFINTGCIDSKFGFAYETGEAMQAAARALRSKNLHLAGIHCHIGSQIFETKPFVAAAEIMMRFLKEIKDQFNVILKEIDLGGGFGIAYTSRETPIPLQDYMEPVSAAIKRKSEEYQIPLPFILLEPGRSIIAPAGITLYTVGVRKEIPNVRTYLSVDGGMADNPRFALYHADYEAVVANLAGKEKDDIVTIAGKCCESGDIIAKSVALQRAKRGDILAVMATGAYNYSMASNYNRLLKPAVVMIKDKEPRIIVRRQTLAELVQQDV